MAFKSNYTIDELTEMLVDSILEESYMNKQQLLPKVKTFIVAFVQLKNQPKIADPINPNKMDALKLTILKREAERSFWLNLVRTLAPDKIQEYYRQSDAFLKEKGFE